MTAPPQNPDVVKAEHQGQSYLPVLRQQRPASACSQSIHLRSLAVPQDSKARNALHPLHLFRAADAVTYAHTMMLSKHADVELSDWQGRHQRRRPSSAHRNAQLNQHQRDKMMRRSGNPLTGKPPAVAAPQGTATTAATR